MLSYYSPYALGFMSNNSLIDYINESTSRKKKEDYGVQDIHVTKDILLELFVDNDVKNVTWRGITMSACQALDILKNIFDEEGIAYKSHGTLFMPAQLEMWEEL